MIQSNNIQFEYNDGATFNFPDIHLDSGENILISGESGIGKTTFLHIMALLLKPKNGEFIIDHENLFKLKESRKDLYRGKNIGVIFQTPYYIRSLNLYENLLAKIYFTTSKVDSNVIDATLERLQIDHLKNKKLYDLSEGQKQRFSVALATINKPKLILADEPTSSLDLKNANEVISLLQEISYQSNSHLVLITHDKRLNSRFDKILEL